MPDRLRTLPVASLGMIISQLLPPANEVCEGHVFTLVCQSFCSGGGVCLMHAVCWDTQPHFTLYSALLALAHKHFKMKQPKLWQQFD